MFELIIASSERAEMAGVAADGKQYSFGHKNTLTPDGKTTWSNLAFPRFADRQHVHVKIGARPSVGDELD
jgi:hypothetical protein